MSIITKSKLLYFYIIAFLLYLALISFYYFETIKNAKTQSIAIAQETAINYQAVKKFSTKNQRATINQLIKEGQVKLSVFKPEFNSCTYAVTKVNEHYNEILKSKNKEALKVGYVASNPRNKNNTGTAQEIEILKNMKEKNLETFYEFKTINDKKYLYYAVAAQKATKECLECHGSPNNASELLIKAYNDKDGFFTKEGEVRGYMKIIIPIDEQYDNAFKMFGIFFAGTTIAFLLIVLVFRFAMLNFIKQSNRIQAILDSKEEIVLVSDGKQIISVNSAFLKFFDVKSIDEFTRHTKCVCERFLKDDDFFHLGKIKGELNWIEYLSRLNRSEHIVKLAHKDTFRLFNINVVSKNLKDDSFKYIVTLTDVTEIKEQSNEYQKKSQYDFLTKVMNRSKLTNELDNLIYKNNVFMERIFCFILLDIDHFKKINDTYGHDIGDVVLQNFAKIIQENIRSTDLFGRWGGEEFALILTDTNINEGSIIADKLRVTIKETTLHEKIGIVTTSGGVVSYEVGDSADSLFKKADTALYQAKNSGRDQIVIAS